VPARGAAITWLRVFVAPPIANRRTPLYNNYRTPGIGNALSAGFRPENYTKSVINTNWRPRWPARWQASGTMDSHLLVVSGVSSCRRSGRSEAEMNLGEEARG
jgi:hypothetical protein